MRRLHVVRADLAAFPADVVVLPTRGHFRGKGAAGNVADAIEARYGVDLRAHARATLRGDVPDGEARLLVPVPARGRASDCPRVVCVHASSHAGISQPVVQRALTEALGLATEALGDKIERTIALPAIGAGIAGARPREAANAMRSAIEAWLQQPGDEVLYIIAWEPANHRAFVECFADLLERDPRAFAKLDGFRDEPALGEAFARLDDTLRASRSVLFIGSGFSRNAVPGMPGWESLFDPAWLPQVPYDRGLLPDFAQVAADECGRAAVEQRFLAGVSGASLPSPAHYALLSLPWGAIVTTNYDDLIERTLRALRTPSVVVTHDEQVADLDSRRVVPVVKIHGGFCEPECPFHADPSARPFAPIVATRDDYDGFFDHRPAIAAYLEAKLLTARGVIVGYSVNDPHLRSLFARVGSVKSQEDQVRLTCLSTDPSPIERYWRHRGLETIVVPLLRDGLPGNAVDFILASCNRAWAGLYERQLPVEYLAARHAALLEGLPLEAQRTLVSLLLEAGCRLPAGLSSLATSADGGLALHLSPERAHAALPDPPG